MNNKMARFFCDVRFYVPFFYEDGEQDGYEPSNPVTYTADSVTEMAEKLSALEHVYDFEMYAKEADNVYSQLYWLNDIDENYIYDSMCDAIAHRMKFEKDFRELAIRYQEGINMTKTELMQWHRDKMVTISRLYMKGKINFYKKLSFQVSITHALFERM